MLFLDYECTLTYNYLVFLDNIDVQKYTVHFMGIDGVEAMGLSPEMKAQIWAKTQGYCWYCGKLMNPWDDFTVDHMDPRKNGGGDEVENLVPACKGCNSRKNAKSVEEFRTYIHEKRVVKFWGENNATAIVEETEEYEECEICQGIQSEVNNVVWYAPYGNDPIMLTLVLIAYKGANGPVTMHELSALTHQNHPLVLAHVFRLLRDGVIKAQWNERGSEYWLQVKDLQMMWEEAARQHGRIP
jgi:hypothetical protein